MLVDCPDCSSSYRLSPDDIGERGRLLICSRCEARWFHQGTRPLETFGAAQASWRFAHEVPGGSNWAGPQLAGSLAGTKQKLTIPHARRLAAIGAVAIVAMAFVGKRDLVVRAMPRASAIYRVFGLHVNVRGLELTRVAAKDEASGDVTIAGEIRNVAGRRVRIPRLAFEVRDRGGATLMTWSQNAPSNTLAVGRTIAFASAPHRPPPDGQTVVVRFDDGDPVAISAVTHAP